MRPPWEVEPDLHADKFWIVAKSEYREQWRDWFCGLPDAEQASYKNDHHPPQVCAQFYEVFGRPKYDPVAAADKHRDAEGKLPPPWIAFPQIGLGSIGWRMGAGEAYWLEFVKWYRRLQPQHKLAFQEKYPEPTKVEHGYPWTGFYARLEK